MLKLAIIGRVREQGLALLRERTDLDIAMCDDGPPESIADTVRGADAILIRTSKLDRALLDTAPDLRVVSRHGVGYDNVDVRALNERRIPLAVSATANMTSVAEHAMFMMLELAKAGRIHDRAVRQGDWATRSNVRAFDLLGRTLLLVGFGRIGREVARRALAFGMRVEVYDPLVGDARLEEVGCERAPLLEPALAQADFVSLHLPLDDRTHHLIGSAELGLMNPGAFLINTARGGLIDEQALALALDEGLLAGAGLDVLEAEPPPSDHPLLGHAKVLLSPHTAAVTEEAMQRMAMESAQNVLDILDGKRDSGVIVNLEQVQET